jgi:hypothetical protein
MKHENNIDNYFNRVKQNPPLMDIEKVHQILTNTEVKAKVEVKKGHRNLLKFTIMTTIFAVILSAVFWWPSHSMEIPNNNPDSQISNTVSQTSSTMSDLDENGTTNKNHDLSLVNSLKNKEESETESKASTAKSVQSEEKSKLENGEENSSNVVPNGQYNSLNKMGIAQHNEHQPGGVDSIKPIDGNQFIIRANKSLLEKLGLTIKGAGIYYQNDTPESGLVTRHIYNGTNRSFYYSMHHSYISDSTIVSKNDFYLQMVTYVSGQTIDFRNGYHPYEMANDTLLPILIPVGLINSKEINDVIYWFRITDDLFEITNMSSELKEKMKKAILLKREHPKANIVDYYCKPTLSGTEFIELNAEELKPLGIYRDGGYFKLRYRKDKSTIGERYIAFDIEKDFENKYWDSINYHYIPAVTDTFGLLKSMEGDFNFDHLVPVLARREIWIDNENPAKDVLPNNLVFWFEPSLSFFNALPKEIGDKLKTEYNYITAEDKSALVQPECKYFDECKNTLAVSKFKVYPNPANNTATVSFTLPEAIDGRITLVDLTGRERQLLQPQTTFAKGQHQIDVDVSSVPGGIYLLILYSDKGVQTQRIIVAR